VILQRLETAAELSASEDSDQAHKEITELDSVEPHDLSLKSSHPHFLSRSTFVGHRSTVFMLT